MKKQSEDPVHASPLQCKQLARVRDDMQLIETELAVARAQLEALVSKTLRSLDASVFEHFLCIKCGLLRNRTDEEMRSPCPSCAEVARKKADAPAQA